MKESYDRFRKTKNNFTSLRKYTDKVRVNSQVIPNQIIGTTNISTIMNIKDENYDPNVLKINIPTLKIRQKVRISVPKIVSDVDAIWKKVIDKNTFFDDLLSDIEVLQQYKILSLLGKGNFSSVSLALDRQNRNSLALKTYEKVDHMPVSYLQNIRQQINSLKQLQHKNIVKLFHVVKQRKKLYLLMENGGQKSLAGLLRKKKFLGEQKVRFYFKQLLEAVNHVHLNGICHRDLKPQNILITQNDILKLIDFGFSTNCGKALTSFCGTAPFMCPQIILKLPYNGYKVDIWALGVIMFLLLVGRYPFSASNEQQLNRLIQQGKYQYRDRQVSKSAKNMISRMLQPQPDKRPTAKQLLEEKWLLQQ